MRRLGLGVVVAAALVVGCGERPEAGLVPATHPPVLPTPTQTGGATDPGAGLAQWQDFPVDRRPRPIVLLQHPPQMAGFTTDEAKVAAMAGNFEVTVPLPPTPPTVTVRLPEGTTELPALPAEEALEGLRNPAEKGRPNPTDALPITRVELGTARFLTDRGELELPSWLFHPVDGLGPIAWPALRADAFWRLGEFAGALGGGARLDADGRTLTVPLPAPSQACPGGPVIRHEPVVTESATAVAVGVRPVVVSTAPGPPVTNCLHTLVLRFEPHQVNLAEPLGARVLVDGKGVPMAVTP